MKRADIKDAVMEAQRFIDRVQELLTEWDAGRATHASFFKEYPHCEPTAPKQSGAVRRASMDLTRALAKMRRPG